MSRIPDISKLSFSELRMLRSEVDRRMAELQEREKHRLAGEWRKEAAEIGVRAEEILQIKKRKIPPKYRNPENPRQTWAGRGKKPRWVVAHEKAGGDKEDLRIKGS